MRSNRWVPGAERTRRPNCRFWGVAPGTRADKNSRVFFGASRSIRYTAVMPRYLRYLRIAFSATCLIACVLLIALWVRSYWRDDGLYWNIVGHRTALIASTHGRLVGYIDLFEIDRWNE